MTKKSKMLIALLLAMVMILATACSSSDEVKQPANVNGDHRCRNHSVRGRWSEGHGDWL